MTKQSKDSKVIIVSSVLLSILVVSYLFTIKSKKVSNPTPTMNPIYQQQYDQSTKAVPTIESSSSLDSAAKELDNTDTTQIDVQLNQINSDSSTF